MKKKELLIVIPAYNEEKNILNAISNVRKVMQATDLAVVNDGSVDKTAALAADAGVILINHPVNLGDGAARQTGFKYALEKGYEYVINLDADGQHDPIYLPKILEELKRGDYDIVIGSRFLSGGYDASPFLRRLGMRIFSRIILFTTGMRILDPTSGFRGVNNEAMKFYVRHFYPEYYPDADVIIASHRAGLKIKEIAVKMNKRTQGNSLHSGLSPIYYIYKMCLSIFTTIFYKKGGQDVN
jgi:glycosyltransferase involved in cell wall biosynthesis